MDQGEGKPFDWKPSPNMCRCCLTDGCNKDIASTYYFSGKKEVYGEMLKETLDIQITQHHVSQQICEECIIQLRNALAFKQNILWSEATLSQYYDTLQHSYEVGIEPELKPYMKTEPIPEECSNDDRRDHAGMDDDATPDDSELEPQCAFAGDQELLETCPDTSPLCLETFDNKPTLLTDRPTAGRGTGDSGNEVFQCDNHLHEHKRLHKDGFPYTCKTCDMKFTTRRLFDTHKRQHAEETTQYSCELCDKKFVTKRRLLAHKKFTRDRPHSCKICNLHYSQRDQLDEHLERHTGNYYRYVCHVCKKGFHFKYLLMIHMRVHTGAKSYTCGACNKQFTQKQNLNSHIRLRHKDGFLYNCKMCDMKFITKHLFDTHKRQHAEETTHYSSELCDKKFVTKSGLITHKNLTGDRPNSCKINNIHYSERSKIQSHLECNTKDYYRFACDVCKKGFNVKSNLIVHMRVHTGVKPYSCPTCKKQFKQKPHLNRHIQRLHKDVCLFDTHKRQHAEETIGHSSELCDKKIITKSALITHKTLTGDRPYSCKICNINYSQRSQLDEHLERHTRDDYQFVCEVCKKGFNVKSNLIVHMRIHTGAKPYSCPTCKRQFTQKPHLNRHIQRLHKDVCLFDTHKRQHAEETTRHSSELCDKKFVKKSGLLTRIKITDDRLYSCKICNLHYSQRSQLDEHLQRHTGNYYRFVCDVCKKGFSFRKNLIKHMLIHMGIKPYSCDTCKKLFREKSHLNEHTRRLHKDVKIEKPVKGINYCQICKKQFTTKSYLKRHMGMHATGPDRNEAFCCDKCGKQFKNKSYFMVHFRSHMGVKPYSCGICNKQFQSSSSLVAHKRVVHSGEKPYPCEICGKRFGQRSTLKTHLLVHSGQKSFSCEVCNKQFGIKSALTVHRRVHTGERPFTCEFCPKAFRLSAGLITHRRIHTGEKPFACTICNVSYTFESSLRKHTRSKHIRKTTI